MMEDMRRELKDVRASIDASGGEDYEGKKRRKESVDFVLDDGGVLIQFLKLVRAPNGSSREWLIERAVAHVARMKVEGIPLNLIRVVITTNIVVEVFGLVS